MRAAVDCSSFPRRSRRNRGGVIVEMIVALPLIVLFFVGLFELGRKLGQVNWVNQVTFNAAYLGAGTPQVGESRVESTQKLAAQLFLASHYNEFKATPNFTPNFVASYDDDAQLVNVRFKGNLRELLPGFYDRDVTIDSWLPYLGPANIQYSETFQNPLPLYCLQPTPIPYVTPPFGCPTSPPSGSCGGMLPQACTLVMPDMIRITEEIGMGYQPVDPGEIQIGY